MTIPDLHVFLRVLNERRSPFITTNLLIWIFVCQVHMYTPRPYFFSWVWFDPSTNSFRRSLTSENSTKISHLFSPGTSIRQPFTQPPIESPSVNGCISCTTYILLKLTCPVYILSISQSGFCLILPEHRAQHLERKDWKEEVGWLYDLSLTS